MNRTEISTVCLSTYGIDSEKGGNALLLIKEIDSFLRHKKGIKKADEEEQND